LRQTVLLFLLFLTSCTPYGKLTVVNVTDGDTALLSNGRQIRYIGIDTPETHVKRNGVWTDRVSPFGKEAEELNRTLVEGKPVRIEFDIQKEDSYGRMLGYVFVADTFVNKRLLEEGYAVLYTYPPNIAHLQELLEAQQQARRRKKGLWKDLPVLNADQAVDNIGDIRTVRDTVSYCFCSQKACFLYLGQEGTCKIVIFKNSFDYFSDTCNDICSCYLDTTVEVTGRLREHNGPEIIVNVPEEIGLVN